MKIRSLMQGGLMQGVEVTPNKDDKTPDAPKLQGSFTKPYSGSVDTNGYINLNGRVNTQKGVNISAIHPVIAGYMESLPEKYRSKLVVSSGMDSGSVHKPGSKHGKGEALDISLKDVDGNESEEIANYLANDPKAKQLGLFIQIEKNKGSNPNGRHVHMQTTDEAIKKYNSMIPKMAYGGYVPKRKMAGGGTPYQAIGSLAGMGIDLLNPDDKIGGNIASGALKGAGTGAGIGTMIFPGVGTAVGAGVGALAGGLISGFQAKKRNDQLNAQNATTNRLLMDNNISRSNAVNNVYQNYRTNGGYSYYAQGGIPPNAYEAEKGEVIQGQDVQLQDGQQLASDIHQVGGNTHANGGTMAQGGEKVYSDRIVIGEDMSMLLKQAGYNFDKKKTYAEVAIQLGKNKAKYEEPSKSKDKITGQTGKIMLTKLDALLEIVFAGQEQYKGQNQEGQQQFAYGGYVRKMAGGGLIPYQQALTDTISQLKKWNELDSKGNTILSSMIDIKGKRPTLKEMEIKPFKSKPFSVNTDRFDFAKNHDSRVNTLNNYNKQIQNNQVDNKFDFQSIVPYLQAGAGALSNRAYLNRIKTLVPANLLSNPNYNYNDRSGANIRDIDNTTRSLMTNLDRNGGNTTSKAAVYGKSLEAKSNIRGRENERLDAYNQQYTNQAYQVNAANNQIINQKQQLELANNNQQQMRLMGADNANLTNLSMIQRERNQQNLDYMRMALMAKTANIGRGVTDYETEQAENRIKLGKGTGMDYFNRRINTAFSAYGG